MPPKDSGSTWVTSYEGKLWPVVICDDTTAPEIFMRSRPLHDDVSPAILLGKLKYIWVAGHRLYEFEPHKDYIQGEPFQTEDVTEADSVEDMQEKTRRKAFLVDAMNFQTPTYWKNAIEQRSQARAREREEARLREQVSSDDDDLVVVNPRKIPSSANSSKPRRSGKDTHFSKKGYPPTPISTTKKPKTRKRGRQEESDESSDDLFVRDGKSQSDPFTSLESDEIEREKNRRSVQQNPPGDDICVIFVGPRHIPFFAPKNKGGVSECDFLGNLVIFTEEHRSHINLDEHVNIEPREFIPIADYLRKGEFAPRLIKSRTLPRLENVVLPEEKDEAAKTISKVYLAASKIQYAALQMLCVKKLKLLQPLTPNWMLIVLMLVMKAAQYGCEAEREIKGWLVGYLAKHFWGLVEYEGPTLARLMREHDEIWRCVLGKLAKDPKMGSQED